MVVDSQPNLQLADTTGGVFTYNYTGAPPAIKSGTILLSEQGEGYLRNVISVTDQGGKLVVNTQQATLDRLLSS